MPTYSFRFRNGHVSFVPRRFVHRVSSVQEAKRLLEAALEERGASYVRHMVSEFTPFAHRLNDDELIERAAEAIALGSVIPVTWQEQRPPLDTPEIIPLADLAGPLPEPRRAPAKDWIGLRLVDLAGAPVADEPYRIVLADGTEVEGRTDAQGRAVHRDVARGSCRISLMNARGGDWGPAEEVRTQASTPETSSDTSDVDDADEGTIEATESDLVAEPDDCPEGTTFLVVEVENDRGDPVTDEPYRVTLPDGQTQKGTLDPVGRLELTGLQAEGTCRVSFDSPILAPASRPYKTGTSHRVIIRTT